MTAKKNIMRKFRMFEISGVDKPAQAGALVSLMKRATPTEEDAADLQKRAGITSATRGHTHLVVINYEDDYERSGDRTHGTTSYADGHSHPWIMNDQGQIVIGEAAGHTHELVEIGISQSAAWDFLNKNFNIEKEVGDMTPEEMKAKAAADLKAKADADAVKKSLEDLQADNARLAVLATMTDVEKGYHASLDDAGKAEFLAKSAADRVTIAKAAEVNKAAADPVIFKSADGQEFRKSDDPRLVSMAKQMDADRKELAISKAAAQNAAFAKTANEDFKYLPGDESVRIALAKAVDGIADETLKAGALAALKAHNAKMAPAFKNVGAGGQGSSDTDDGSAAQADAELDALAKSIAAKDGISYYDAYEKAGVQKPDLLKRAISG